MIWSSCTAFSTPCTTIVDVVDSSGVRVTQAPATNATHTTTRLVNNVHPDRRQEREIRNGRPHGIGHHRASDHVRPIGSRDELSLAVIEYVRRRILRAVYVRDAQIRRYLYAIARTDPRDAHVEPVLEPQATAVRRAGELVQVSVGQG